MGLCVAYLAPAGHNDKPYWKSWETWEEEEEADKAESSEAHQDGREFQ